MSGKTEVDRKERRRQATRDEIVEAAWALAREKGLAGLSLRDLGERVGMRAQSLYSYFSSKNEIYDAMYAEGYRAAQAMADALDKESASAQSGTSAGAADREIDRFAAARARAKAFFTFCTSDPVRYQLLFQRTIPDFEPSPESYAIAVSYLEDTGRRLARLGVDTPERLDLWTAVLTGFTDQQMSNDPGGDRWERIFDDALDMLFDHLTPGWRERNAAS